MCHLVFSLVFYSLVDFNDKLDDGMYLSPRYFFLSLICNIDTGKIIDGILLKPTIRHCLVYILSMVKSMLKLSIYHVRTRCIFMVFTKYRTYQNNDIHFQLVITPPLNCSHSKFSHQTMQKRKQSILVMLYCFCLLSHFFLIDTNRRWNQRSLKA